METEGVLKEFGLTNGEIKVYLSLLKLGPSTVNKIRQDTKIHRTTIYDFLERLINLGLASCLIRENAKCYQASNPDKFIDIEREKEEKIKRIIPSLKELSKIRDEDVSVKVYSGEEGVKNLLNDILEQKENLVAFGIDESKFQEKFPFLMDNYFKKEQEIGTKERVLTKKRVSFTFQKENVEYRYIPEKYFNPTPTMIYGNKLAFVIWVPLTVVIIKNKDLAEGYKKHFEMLWRKASKSRGTKKM